SASVIPSASKITCPRKTNPIATQNAVKIPRAAWCLRWSGEALDASPMNIATSPIGSIATKTGMKATKNFWIIVAQVSDCVTAQNATQDGACLLRPPTDVRRHLTFMKSLLLFLLLVFVASSHNLPAAELKTVDDFRAAAAKPNALLTIPDWEQTPKAVEAMMNDAIAKANTALDQI